jgi:asparagine synthase (glutamine-hydrolysing)
MGFPVPLAQWMRGRWKSVVDDVLLDHRTRDRGIIDPGAVSVLIQDHVRGRIDASDRLWSLMTLKLWYRTFIDNMGIQTLPAPRSPTTVSPPYS